MNRRIKEAIETCMDVEMTGYNHRCRSSYRERVSVKGKRLAQSTDAMQHEAEQD